MASLAHAVSPLPSSRSSYKSRASLSLDLSSLPAYQPPTPPSNTLIITNLNDPEVFRADNIQAIKNLVNSAAPIHSWAPLKSFRRIIVSFFDEDAAIRIRQILDGEPIMGERVKVYFGAQTSIQPRDEHLNLPDAGKLFFISPPPSPPHGWEVKMEDAPNKQVHADDLAEALAKLHHSTRNNLPISPANSTFADGRNRSASCVTIYHPEDHGDSPMLPAIEVEDMTDEPETISPIGMEKPIMAHTSRPPVELM